MNSVPVLWVHLSAVTTMYKGRMDGMQQQWTRLYCCSGYLSIYFISSLSLFYFLKSLVLSKAPQTVIFH